MEALRASGLDAVVRDAAESGVPFLGICVGMQMLFEGSEEAPGVNGLGLLDGMVRRLPDSPGLKLPHMGWNTLEVRAGSKLLAGLGDAPWMYFVHSYAPTPDDESIVSSWSEYGGRVVATVERGSVWATQFHPEKSGVNGLALLANFVSACQ